MESSLYAHYERELIFIRQLSQEFARQYPAAAGRLLLEPNRSLDPHVERLIESFALLTGRVNQKLDDEYPELTTAMLGVLYPHYLAPIPSMTILQFELDYDRAQLPDGFVIPRGSRLQSSPVDDVPCRFRTGYDAHLWPVQVASARYLSPPFPPELGIPFGTAAAIRLRLECRSGLAFSQLTLESLRFYLDGEPQVVAALYEAMLNNVIGVSIGPPGAAGGPAPTWIDPADCLRPVGFGEDEGLLPYPPASFVGYRLLTEYFAFPSKFQFIDLAGLERTRDFAGARAIDVVIRLNRSSSNLEQAVGVDTFRQGCTPAVNLFERTAEPIPLTQARFEYRVIPDVATPFGAEVYSVDEVVGIVPGSPDSVEYRPFYAFPHGSTRADRRSFWYASRRPSLRPGDRGTDVELNLVDLDFDPRLPAESTLVVRATCTNRDLPVRLQHLGDRLSFGLEAAAPISGIRCLRMPSPTIRPPDRRGAHWRLISHLCLNHLSITDPIAGRDALKEILRLYDSSGSEAASATIGQIIDGITSVSSRRVVGRIESPEASGFCRGTEVTVELDEANYVGTGAYLFASVIERFLGLYVSINAFSQLVVKFKSKQGTLKRWPPRAGERQIL